MATHQTTHSDHVPRSLWLVLAGLTLIWGFNWTAMKVAITEVQPLTFRTVCLVSGALLLFGYLRATGQALTIPRAAWPRLALIAFFNITLWNLLVVFGLGLMHSGRAAIIAYTMPAWAIPLSVLVLGDRITGRKLFGLALGMAGMALLILEEIARLRSAPLGALLMLGAAWAWAIGTVLQKKMPVPVPVGTFTAWLMVAGGIPIHLGTFLIEDPRHLASISGPAWAGLAFNAIIVFGWAHWAWIKLSTAMSVTVFSLSMLMIPIVGVLSGALILAERPGWPEFAALALVLGSLLTVIVPQRPR
ncbi:MAG: DMT family transporter [Proteobacteria bacterium]|nr:DMT family transporter [Pseudomonadota bacterium]